MAISPTNSIDKRLAEMYADKVTVNLERSEIVPPDDVWKTMQMIAVNNKALVQIIYK